MIGRFLRLAVAWVAACLLVLINWTCRRRLHADPRPALRAARQPYIYAILHAHQIAAALNHGEELCGAMVSRSADGDLLMPLCRLSRIRPFRGSTRKGARDKGGQEALEALIAFVRSTGKPCTMAVDGPRGPRNHVYSGVTQIAVATGAHIVAATVIPRARWILSRTWDRLQIPKPFTTLDLWFAPPIDAKELGDPASLRVHVERTLTELEAISDPIESARCLSRIPCTNGVRATNACNRRET